LPDVGMNQGIVLPSMIRSVKETMVLHRGGEGSITRQFDFINSFGFINWVYNVNWPPLRDSKAYILSISPLSVQIKELCGLP